MESPSKASINGMEGVESKGRELVVAKHGACDLLLRLLALVLTLVATIIVGVDKQTKVVSIQLIMPAPVNVAVTAKWHYLSAFVYFVVANAIACAYAAVSLVLSKSKSKSKWLGTLISEVDALMVALLFSCNGAATAVGVLGFQGNSHLQWNKVCNVFDKFCHQVAASIILSLLGSLAFLLLVLLRLHPRT